MTAVTMRRPLARAWSRVWAGRNRYLVGAVCLTICAFMLAPIVFSVLTSLKTRAEAAAIPPTYFPHELSLDNYARLWSYQAGLPTYFGNSLATALMTIAFTLLLTDPGGLRPGTIPGPGQGGHLRLPAACLDHPVPGAADADLPDVRLAADQADEHAGRAGHPPHGDPAAVQPVHHAQQLRGGPTELEEAALTDGGNSFQILRSIFIPAVVPAIVTVMLFAFVTSWNEFLGALVLLSRASTFTLPLILASARAETSLGGTDWGMLQAGITSR